jgi:glycosyltransferase involved in cell wall biosynthesis
MIGGDGPLLQDLKITAKSQNFDVENIFVGQIESAEKFLQQIDIYVSLNTGSVTGIAGLEAVFSGIPVVALQTLPDYITKHSDWIYSSYTPTEVAIKIHEVATREALAQSEARTQLEVAQTKFTSSVMSAKYGSLYNSRGSLGTDQKSGQINLLT